MYMCSANVVVVDDDTNLVNKIPFLMNFRVVGVTFYLRFTSHPVTHPYQRLSARSQTDKKRHENWMLMESSDTIHSVRPAKLSIKAVSSIRITCGERANHQSHRTHFIEFLWQKMVKTQKLIKRKQKTNQPENSENASIAFHRANKRGWKFDS